MDLEHSSKIKTGIKWATVSSLTGKGFVFVSGIILARLLTPEEFGLIAIAMAIILISMGSTSAGIDAALVQRKGDITRFLDVAWSLELIRYLLLFVVVFSMAGYLADLFDEAKLRDVIRVLSLIFLLHGFKNIGIVYFRKDLDFKKIWKMEMAMNVCNFIVCFTIAIQHKSVWALVVGYLVGQSVFLLLSYYMHPYRPRFKVSLAEVREIMGFSKWLLASSLLVIVSEQGMIMIIGKVLGVTSTGLYERANSLYRKTLLQLAEIAWKVGFPAIASVQSDGHKIRNIYAYTLSIIMLIGIPACAIAYFGATYFVEELLGDQWIRLIPIMELMSLVVFVAYLGLPASILFQAIGRPEIGVKLSLLRLALMFALVFPLMREYGLAGAVLALLASSLAVLPIQLIAVYRVVGLRFRDIRRSIVLPFTATSVIVGVTWLIGISNIYEFAAATLIGLAFYFILVRMRVRELLATDIFTYGSLD